MSSLLWSTLLNLIGGLEQPDEGRVLIDGRAIWKEPHPAHARRELADPAL